MTATVETTVAELLPGDVLYDLGAGPVDHFTVAAVQHLGPLAIIDFADGTATAPVGGATPVRVRRGPAGT